MEESTWTRQRIHAWLKALVPLALVMVLFWMWGRVVLTVLAPFVVAFLLAYIFHPVVIALEGRNRKRGRIPRILAVTILYVALLVVALVFCLILVRIIEELVIFGQRLPDYGARLYGLLEGFLQDQLERVPPETVEWVRQQLSRENLERVFFESVHPRLKEADLSEGAGMAAKGIAGFLQLAFTALGGAARQLLGGAGSVVTFVSSATLVLVITFYLLLDYDRLRAKLRGCIPKDYRESALRILSRVDRQLSGFLRGQLLVCVCIGTLVAIGLSLAGVDYALLIGLAAGVFNIIPYLGPVMGAIPAVIVTILEEYQPALAAGQEAAREQAAQGTDWQHLAIRLGVVIGVFIAVQTLDGFLISPKIMGNKLDLHPMIILFALLLGGALFGLVGMLIAVPIACIVRVLIEEIYFPDPRRSAC